MPTHACQNGEKSMRRLPNQFEISPGNAEEIDHLIEVDKAAGQMFAGLGVIRPEALADHVPADVLQNAIEDDDLCVVRKSGGPAVGFVMTSARGGTLYLEQISVSPDVGRQGIGSALVRQVFAKAKQRKVKAVTLSTFRDVPWNGPFYKRHGFKEIPRKKMTDWMLEIEAAQAEDLDIDERCFMTRKVGWF
jgi:predicted N-acetyltransferase YhbS